MDIEASPLAKPFPDLPSLPGVELRIAHAGYRDWERADMTYACVPDNTAIAGVFTQSACASPEVEAGRMQISQGRARALIVNAGNANAFTGGKGRAAVDLIQRRMSEHLGCSTDEVFVSSTGVIGEPLPQDKAENGLAEVVANELASWEEAAIAIGTTDTFPKAASTSAMVGDKRIDLVGIIKGSGMIAPDMATMLGYIFTDASVAPEFLQTLLEQANQQTFSCITVDGDTSTSDTVLAFATGTAGTAELVSFDSPGADAFAAALSDLCRQLAHLVVRDGEGASKFIQIRVSGAASDDSARKVGLAVANSPLVKTAIAGEDANWGRVVMAVGKAGEPADRDKLAIAFGGTEVANEGLAVDGYDEAPVAAHLKGEEIDLAIDLGIGSGQATVWTCDLTHGYISINADYRS